MAFSAVDEPGSVKVTTNNVPRPILYGYQLSAAERAEFDYLTDEEFSDGSFFRYRGSVYDLGDIPRAFGPFADDWDGCLSDSFFSGIVVRYPRDDMGRMDCESETVVVGFYCC